MNLSEIMVMIRKGNLGPVPTERLRLRRRKQLGSVNFYATIHI